MINRIYRLMDTKRIDMVQREVSFGAEDILIKPRFVSVCAADQRYYHGNRKREVMRKKLPMALIHEATATVLFDPNGAFSNGEGVVPIPLLESPKASVKPNYDERSEFRSSGRDGFLCDYITAPKGGYVVLPDNNSPVYVFSELVSVAFNALDAFERCRVTECDSFGVWGDGSLGYIVALVLRHLYPSSKIYVFGKTARKLHRFSFADDFFFIDEIPDDLRINHAFECAGGVGSESAIRQIIDMITPQGCIALLSVSEVEISVNTRIVLEKGLRLIGNSRSDSGDFQKAVNMISESISVRKYLETLISEVIDIRVESDISRIFENDILNDFKTVGRWLL